MKAAGSRNCEGSSANQGLSLTDAIRTGASSGRQGRATPKDGEQPPPTLNPRFVEWLMGVPRDWTDASDSGFSEMELSRWWRLMRSELSRLERASPPPYDMNDSTDDIEARLDHLDARLGGIEYVAEAAERLEIAASRVEGIEARVAAIEGGELLDRDITADRLAQVEGRLDALEGRGPRVGLEIDQP